MNPLKLFYENETQREAVKTFLIDNLKEMAVDTVFDKKATAGIYEAKKVIDKSFEKLEEIFAERKPTVIDSAR
jgi:hypothetical protein